MSDHKNDKVVIYHIDGVNIYKMITGFKEFFINNVITPTMKDVDLYEDDKYFENIIFFDEQYNYPIKGYYSFEWKKQENLSTLYKDGSSYKVYYIKMYERPGYEDPDKYHNKLDAHKFICEYMIWWKNDYISERIDNE